ncbi:MAG TPA: hypothetical protein VJH03_20475 [Blastocatellia bacterium]|nr:hypothetical protein [Blastocatellia bacterium]
MGLGETVIIYLAIGIGVAIAVLLRAGAESSLKRGYLAAIAVLFWPILLPPLFSAKPASPADSAPRPESEDPLAARIAEVEREMSTVVNGKQGVAERALAIETQKIRSLIGAIRAQAARLQEMKRLLETLSRNSDVDGLNGLDPVSAENVRGRRRNLDRLRHLHDNTEQQLWRVITRIEELISMIYVARFAGGQREEIERLLNEIAATVESISAVVLDDQVGDHQPTERRAEA